MNQKSLSVRAARAGGGSLRDTCLNIDLPHPGRHLSPLSFMLLSTDQWQMICKVTWTDPWVKSSYFCLPYIPLFFLFFYVKVMIMRIKSLAAGDLFLSTQGIGIVKLCEI